MKQQDKIAITISDPVAKERILELQNQFPNLLGRSITHNVKKFGVEAFYIMCSDYVTDQKVKEKAAQKRSYQKNKQSIKDKTTLKRIERTHGKTFIIDNIGT